MAAEDWIDFDGCPDKMDISPQRHVRDDAKELARQLDKVSDNTFDVILVIMNARAEVNSCSASRRIDQCAQFVNTTRGQARVEILRAQPWYSSNQLNPSKRKKSSMDKNIAALMRRDARTVHVVFRSNSESNCGWGTKRYTYVSHLELQPGDQVIVPMGYGTKELEQSSVTTIAWVKAVDDTVKIEPNSDITYKWVISKIDMTAHEANMQHNMDIEAMVADAYRESLRASFSTRVLEFMDADKRAAVTKLLG